MRARSIILWCILAVALPGAARADFTMTHESAPVWRTSPALPATESLPISVTENVEKGFSTTLPGVTRSPLPASSAEGAQKVYSLPAAPSSAALFLSAMLSMGAYRLVKQARWTHLGSLPEWYHAEAPHQVGHAVLCDLHFAPVALSGFERPAVAAPVPLSRMELLLRDARPELISTLTLRVPRGPPVLHAL